VVNTVFRAWLDNALDYTREFKSSHAEWSLSSAREGFNLGAPMGERVALLRPLLDVIDAGQFQLKITSKSNV